MSNSHKMPFYVMLLEAILYSRFLFPSQVKYQYCDHTNVQSEDKIMSLSLVDEEVLHSE
jgi:hypothetical protein